MFYIHDIEPHMYANTRQLFVLPWHS